MGEITVLTATNVRELVTKINSKCISKDDIVSLLKDGDQYILLYYK